MDAKGDSPTANARNASASAKPASGAVPPSATAIKVAFLGDSISAGIHLPDDQAFPAVLQRQLAKSGKPFQLLNAGVSGDTTAGGLRRIDWILKQKPQIVVVELGANDAMRGIAPQLVESNLRGILTKIKDSGAKALLLGMRIPQSYGQQHAQEFEAVYPRLAEELEVALVPFFMEGVAGVPELNLQDGIHPTPEGHAKLAETLREPLLQLLD